MNRDLTITATTPGKPALTRTLGDIHSMITSARSADSADIICLRLDAGATVTTRVRGVELTLTPET